MGPAHAPWDISYTTWQAYLAVKETETKLLKDYISRNAAPPPEALQSLVEMKVTAAKTQPCLALETQSRAGPCKQSRARPLPGKGSPPFLIWEPSLP